MSDLDDRLEEAAADLAARLTALLAALPFDDPSHTVPQALKDETRRMRRG